MAQMIGQGRLGAISRELARLGMVLVLAWLSSIWAFGDAGDPPGRVARLGYIQGNVSFQPSGESQWSQASLNYPLTTGDRLYTNEGSRAQIECGPFVVYLSESTDLTVANLNDQIMQLGLGQGVIRVGLYQLPPGNSVEVDTPNGALTLSAAGSYRVETYPDGQSTLVVVTKGSLHVSGGGVEQDLSTGQAAKLTGTGPIQISLMSLPPPDSFDQWSSERDRRVQSFAYSKYVNPYIPGCEDLGVYGRWEVVTDYGPVWYPVGIPVGWVPYRFGRWVWVSPWGWTWVEDEPWGFCPFHYGRWVYVRAAWGWVPGPVEITPVYAPALVAFVGGAGFSLGISIGAPVAWFPLGPREPFFPWYHYGDAYLRQVNVTNIRNVTNITNIINVRNISEIHYVNKPVAMTAVSADVFRAGQHVAERSIRVPPEQIARAQVTPHPSVTPTAAAALGGRPVAAPPVRAAAMRPGIASTSRTLPRSLVSGAPRTPSRLITRNPLPPRALPFSRQRDALAKHPGRPLEPRQIENLRAGRAAGPLFDREFPPHPVLAPRTAPRVRGR